MPQFLSVRLVLPVPFALYKNIRGRNRPVLQLLTLNAASHRWAYTWKWKRLRNETQVPFREPVSVPKPDCGSPPERDQRLSHGTMQASTGRCKTWAWTFLFQNSVSLKQLYLFCSGYKPQFMPCNNCICLGHLTPLLAGIRNQWTADTAVNCEIGQVNMNYNTLGQSVFFHQNSYWLKKHMRGVYSIYYIYIHKLKWDEMFQNNQNMHISLSNWKNRLIWAFLIWHEKQTKKYSILQNISHLGKLHRAKVSDFIWVTPAISSLDVYYKFFWSCFESWS